MNGRPDLVFKKRHSDTDIRSEGKLNIAEHAWQLKNISKLNIH